MRKTTMGWSECFRCTNSRRFKKIRCDKKCDSCPLSVCQAHCFPQVFRPMISRFGGGQAGSIIHQGSPMLTNISFFVPQIAGNSGDFYFPILDFGPDSNYSAWERTWSGPRNFVSQ